MQQKIIMELHPNEAELINKIRTKYNFGDVLLVCRNGLPYSISKTIVSDRKDLITPEDLIEKIKNNYQWGQIVIECKNGLPYRIEKETIYDIF